MVLEARRRRARVAFAPVCRLLLLPGIVCRLALDRFTKLLVLFSADSGGSFRALGGRKVARQSVAWSASFICVQQCVSTSTFSAVARPAPEPATTSTSSSTTQWRSDAACCRLAALIERQHHHHHHHRRAGSLRLLLTRVQTLVDPSREANSRTARRLQSVADASLEGEATDSCWRRKTHSENATREEKF